MQTLYRNNKEALSPLEACQGTTLQKLLEKARYLLSLDKTVQALLPTELSARCRVMNVHDGILVLGAEHAALVTQLRFLSADLLDALQKNAVTGISQIHCRVLLP